MSIDAFPRAVVSFTIVLLVFGIAFGLVAGACELARPFSSIANAERTRIETEYIDEKHQVDIHYYEQVKQTELNTINEKHNQEMQFSAQTHERKMAQAEHRAQTVDSLLPLIVGVILLALLIISVGLAYCLTCIGHSRMLAARATATSHIDWDNEFRRTNAIRQAREAERQWRTAQRTGRIEESNGDGRLVYERLRQVLGPN